MANLRELPPIDPQKLKSTIESYIKNINEFLILEYKLHVNQGKKNALEKKIKEQEEIIIKTLQILKDTTPEKPLPSNITQELLINFFELYKKNTDGHEPDIAVDKKLISIMSDSFLDRLILGKRQKGYPKNANNLTEKVKELIEIFMLSGPPKQGNTLPLARLKFYNYLENNAHLDEKEKQHLSIVHAAAKNALEEKWRKICFFFKEKTNINLFINRLQTASFLFQSQHLPEYITEESLLKFATFQPETFYQFISNENNLLIERLGNLTEFKEKLGTGIDFQKEEAINNIQKKLDSLIAAQEAQKAQEEKKVPQEQKDEPRLDKPPEKIQAGSKTRALSFFSLNRVPKKAIREEAANDRKIQNKNTC